MEEETIAFSHSNRTLSKENIHTLSQQHISHTNPDSGLRLHDRFVNFAKQSPDAIALEFGSQTMTYGELDRKSNSVAFHLQQSGINPNQVVPIISGRSMDLIVGLIGILKSGGAYLPVDPDQPEDRVDFLLSDSQASIALTGTDVRLAKDYRTQLIEISSISDTKITCELKDPANTTDLAYVVYTSGSTGKPKGAMIEHRSIMNCLLWTAEEYDYQETDVQFQKTPITFDVSLHELFGWTMAGSRLAIPPSGAEKDPEALTRLIKEHGVTHVHFVPSMLDSFIEYLRAFDQADSLTSVRDIICIGEALPPATVNAFNELVGHPLKVGIHNLYGPAEAAVHVTYHDCSHFTEGSSVPIGKPVSNTSIYILDENLSPVPGGELGELYIGGIHVGRGYFNRPELTDKVFVRNPFSKQADQIMYRTGDLVRMNEAGELEYQGRNDFQIKIRGVRIEPGEIEAEIRNIPGVSGAAIIAHKSENGQTILIGYFTKNGDSADDDPDGSYILDALRSKLPPQMVPSRMILLAAFPLNPSGKLDRKALPIPTIENSAVPESGAPGLSITQSELLPIWKELLGLVDISIRDDFFVLGGHSITAIRLIARIRQQFQVSLSVGNIFELRTIEHIAAFIDDSQQIEKSPVIEISPRTSKGSYPLTSVQENILLESIRNPEFPVYNEVATIHVGRDNDFTLLQGAVQLLIDAHESFRTSYEWDSGELLQRAHVNVTIEVPVIDFRHDSVEDLEKHVSNYASNWSSEPIDLAKPPLLKAFIGQLSDNDIRLYLTVHHIAADAVTTFDIIVNDLHRYYAALRNRDSIQTNPNTPQYIDYAIWARSQTHDSSFRKNNDYWVSVLKDSKSFELPSDHIRPTSHGHSGAITLINFPKELTEAVQHIANKENTSKFLVLFTAFNILMNRLTHEEDIVVGTVSSSRDQPQTESIAGCFLNYLPLRNKIQPTARFSELLSKIQHNFFEALEHKEVSLLDIQDQLKLKRDASSHPFYQILFLMEPPQENLPADWSVNQFEFHPGTAKLDLTVELDEKDGDIVGRIEFNTDIYSRAFIDQLTEHFEVLIRGIAEHPDAPVKDLPILSEAHRHQVLEQFNETLHPLSSSQRLHDKLVHFAKTQPDTIALEFGTSRLSYGELNTQSNNVAYALQQKGVKPNQVVAVVARRSLYLPVALFGVLKAGGAYLPIDPDLPDDRIQYFISNSEAKLALIDPDIKIPKGKELLTLDLTHLAQQQAPGNIEDNTHPSDLAYVIYTSGSTGKPKGAMIEHRSICNRLEWMASNYGFSDSEVQLLKTPITFDVSVHELFLWSFVGAKLSIAPPAAEKDPAELVRLIKVHEVNHIHFVPSMLDGFLNYVSAFELEDSLTSLRNVYCSGEALATSAVIAFKHLVGTPFQVGLHNLYGPTEAAVDVTYFDCSKLGARDTVPIGAPVWNTQLYVLDKHLNPMPIGYSGDIYIGGVQVGRGYINRHDLTSESFIRNPFSQNDEEKLYKTGDLGRWIPDGNIEYLGRNDFQVKIRGVRIELGEIESAIQEFEGVTKVVVIAKKQTADSPILIAYFTTTMRSGEIGESELRSFIKKRLPEQLIPSFFVPLDEFPLSPSGKMDRKALPEPTTSLVKSSTDNRSVEFSDPVSELLHSIFCEVLEVDHIDRTGGFFEQGGHSLLVIKILGRIRNTLKISLSLPEFLQDPTFDGVLEKILENTRREESKSQIKHTEYPSPLPVSWGQRRMWYLHEIDDSRVGYNIAYGVVFKGSLQLDHLVDGLIHTIKTHEALRTTFKLHNHEPVQIIADQNITISDYLIQETVTKNSSSAQFDRILKGAWTKKFDLETGPLFSAHITSFSDNCIFLSLSLHHIIADEAVEEILYRTIEKSSEIVSSETENPHLQIGDFSIWERSPHYQQNIAGHLEWWEDYLKEAPPLLKLPTDYPNESKINFRGTRSVARLSAEDSLGFSKLLRSLDATQFMGFQVAWSLFLGKLSQSEDIVIGAPLSLRNQPGLESTVGFLINSLPFRTRFSSKSTFKDLVIDARAQTLEIYRHADLPFDKLVDHIQSDRSQSVSPIFQVMLVMNGKPSEGPQFEGVTTEVINSDPESAKFDLTLFVNETDQGFEFKLEYKTALFNEHTIACWLEDFVSFLTRLKESPTEPLEAIDSISNRDRSNQLNWSNGGAFDSPTDSTLASLIHAVASNKPSEIAVQYQNTKLSFQSLNQQAEQLCNSIYNPAIGNRKIGVCFDREPELFVAILATIRSRAAYVPLDSSWPVSRLSWVIEDSGVDLILVSNDETKQQLQSLAPEIEIRKITLSQKTATLSSPVSPVKNMPEDLAYMIYTSGSTGRPKGVLVSQKNAVSSTLARNEVYGDYPERFLLLSPPIFDSSIAGIFWTLTQGGTLVLPAAGIEKDPKLLADLLIEESITHFLCLPSVLDGLLPFLEGKEHSLGTVIVAGETCPSSLPGKLRNTLPGVRLFNEYGPTEGTVWCTAIDITNYLASERIPIGRPIPNSRVYIVDNHLNLLPAGAFGEIAIAGEGLTNGYHNLPQLTDERFLKPNVNTLPEERIYRTGDLGRWQSEGILEFTGRLDDQVKIRGYRIEPGEIEAALESIPQVESVAVIIKKRSLDQAGEGAASTHSFLAAFVAFRKGTNDLNEQELVAQVSDRLPSYMVPTRWILLERLPTTSTGKIDRPALSRLPIDNPVDKEPSNNEMPEGSTLKQLHDIWCQVLGIPSISRTDNFFELGGDSILAISMVSRAKQAGIQISVTDLFKSPTLETLTPADFSSAQWMPVDQLDPVGAFPLTPILSYFCELDLPNPHFWHQNLLLDVSEHVSLELIEASIRLLHECHPSLRMTMDYHSATAQVASMDDTHIEVRHVKTSNINHEELHATIEAEATSIGESIRLTIPSLLKVALFENNDSGSKKLLLVAHHIIVDAVSWQMIIQDLNSLLSPPFRNKDSILPPTTTSFRQWATHLEELAKTGAFENDRTFWMNQPYRKEKSFITDASKEPLFIECEIESVTATIDAKTINEARAKLRDEALDLHNLLTAAFIYALVQGTREPIHTVWMEGHGREDLIPGADLSRTTGWFTSLFPVVFESSLSADTSETIREIKATLSDLPNKGVTYGLLRYWGREKDGNNLREVSGSPEIIFNFLGQTKIAEESNKGVKLLGDSIGLVRDPNNTQKAVLETNVALEGEELVIHFNYNSLICSENTVQNLADSFERFLTSWISIEQNLDSTSIFSSSGLDEDDLETLFN